MSDELRDQIAEAIHGADCGCADRVTDYEDDDYYNKMVAAVLAVVAPRLSEAMAEAEQLQAKIADWEQYETDVRRVLNAKGEALARAESAIERARTDLTAMINRCILQAGHCRQRGDFQREREWTVVADNARKILAALNPAGGSEKGCCDECGGSGHSGDEGTAGACWTCRGTGHPHDGLCVPAGGSEEPGEHACVRIAPEVPGEPPSCVTHNDVWPCPNAGRPPAPLGAQSAGGSEEKEDPNA